ncbi:MAG TPA: sulfotransferase [Solirubrobacteraceae bacterium]|nr:sulfotransferase [Solirubrobacteraceae bacterium]
MSRPAHSEPQPAHSEPQRAPSGRRPKVLYVMGAGRSGSTILGVALGNCEGVFFAGELDKWFAREGAPRREDPALHAFWREALGQVGDVQDVFAARTGWLERSSALLDPRKWRTRRRLRARYRSVSERLYVVVAGLAQATVVVDTSHYPLRARELQALDGIELHLLYLVRDPQSVVASLARRDVAERRFGTLAANAYLWLTNGLSLLVFLRQPHERRLLVRHEDFLADPLGVLAQILAGAGAGAGADAGARGGKRASVGGAAGSHAAKPDLEHLRTGIAFHGNRLLGEEFVALSSRPATAARGSLLTALLQSPWRVLFARLTPATHAAVMAERQAADGRGS